MARIPVHPSDVIRRPDPGPGELSIFTVPLLGVGGRGIVAGGLASGDGFGRAKAIVAYETMLERASLGQITVKFPTFRIEAVNNAFCAMALYSADELVGANAAMLFPADQVPDRQRVADLSSGASDGYSMDRVLRRRDGTILRVRWTVSAIRADDGRALRLLVVTQDLTGERAGEEVRRQSQALIDAAMAALPVTFATMDTDLRFTSVVGGFNPRETPEESFLGKQVSEVTEDKPTLRALQAALAGATSTTRAVVHGQTYVAWNAPMRDSEGAIVGIISVSTNITPEVAGEAKRRQTEDRAIFAARHDPLTGLPSRTALVERVNEIAASGESPRALLLLDLDDFNLVNDSLGHAMGDAVLVEVASRVSEAFPGLMVARYGGDEFAVLAPFAVDRAETDEAAERVRAVLDADVEFCGQAVRITASMGLAIEEARPSTPGLIRNADSALAHAKEAGTGQYRVYDAAMRKQVQRRQETQAGLRAALSLDQLRLAYQPIVDLVDRRIIGTEALLRWTHPKRGLVTPQEFIPIAERSGLIVPIGQWVMNTACHDAVSMQRNYGMYVAVNVSARQLIGGDFAEWLEEALQRTGLPPHALTVEVTESTFMDDVGPIRRGFDRLRSRGIKVSIDDFGTGYSSLARLQRLPVDVIKLDRAFVVGVDDRADARRMASAILELSAAIGAEIVAEGVETEAEAATLLGLGFRSAQGYLFGRPMPIDDLTRRLSAGSRARVAPPATPSSSRHPRLVVHAA